MAEPTIGERIAAEFCYWCNPVTCRNKSFLAAAIDKAVAEAREEGRADNGPRNVVPREVYDEALAAKEAEAGALREALQLVADWNAERAMRTIDALPGPPDKANAMFDESPWRAGVVPKKHGDLDLDGWGDTPLTAIQAASAKE